ncbi:MAG: septum formation protein Maf [Ruminococcaceae bacterium]|nr:septum formation protein Maf [Oscillospiraceae bacterium]
MIEFNNKVILASASPRRQELIKLIFDTVEILPADCDETLPEGIGAREAVEYLSKIKNEASSKLTDKENLIVSADTVVSVGDEILGKPVDKDDARRMISLLSGKVHQVYTGVTISLNGKIKTFSEKTDVEFFNLTKEEIEEYISSKEPYDKAGAYGIQGKAGLLVKGINGDYYNVVGFPVARLKREIEEFII